MKLNLIVAAATDRGNTVSRIEPDTSKDLGENLHKNRMIMLLF